MSSDTPSPFLKAQDINEAATQLNVMVINLKELGVKRISAIEDAESFDDLVKALREARYPKEEEILAAVAECRAEIVEFTGSKETADRCFEEVWFKESLATALPSPSTTSIGRGPGGRGGR